MLHFDGKRWSQRDLAAPYASLESVWGVGPGHVFAAGYDGLVVEVDAKGVKTHRVPVPDATLQSVWASGPKDVWVVGSAKGRGGVALRYDGTSWRTVDLGKQPALVGVWGSSAKDVFVATGHSVLRYDGRSWASMPIADTRGLRAIGGSVAGATKPASVFAVGYPKEYNKAPTTLLRFDPTASGSARWQRGVTTESRTMFAVTAASNGEAFASGYDGAMMHYRAGKWRSVKTPATITLSGLWAFDANDVLAVGGGGTMVRFDGRRWQTLGRDIPGCSLFTVTGSSPKNVFAGGTNTVLHYDGKTWKRLRTGKIGSVFSMWTSGPRDAFAATYDGAIWHYNGFGWTKQYAGKPGEDLVKIWGRGPREVYASGSGGLLRYDGRRWRRMKFPGKPPWSYSVSGTKTRLFVSGGDAVWRYDGRTWTREAGSASIRGDLWAVAKDVYTVGMSGSVSRFDGTKWSDHTWGEGFNALGGTGPSNLYAVQGESRSAASGSIQRFDGKKWRQELQVRYLPMSGVWAAADGTVYAVGLGCTILKRSPER